MRQLAASGDAQAILPLLGAVRDRVPEVAQAACAGLVAMGERAWPALFNALCDAEASVRESAVEVLAAGQVRDAALQLLGLTQDPSPAVRLAAVRATGLFPHQRAVAPLIKLLKDSDEAVRLAAIGQLEAFGDARAYEPLADLVRSAGDSPVRRAAAHALVSRTWPGVTDRQRAQVALAIQEWLVPLGKLDGDPDLGALSALALQELQGLFSLGSDLVRLVAPMLDKINPSLRLWAARLLGQMGDPAALQALLAAGRDSHPEIRKVIANALLELGRLDASGLVVALCSGKWPDLRLMAAQVLGDLGNASAVPFLCEAARDPDARVRLAVIAALGKLRDERAVPVLREATADANREVRQLAVEALAQVPATTAYEALQVLSLSPQDTVRVAAVKALTGYRSGEQAAAESPN